MRSTIRWQLETSFSGRTAAVPRGSISEEISKRRMVNEINRVFKIMHALLLKYY